MINSTPLNDSCAREEVRFFVLSRHGRPTAVGSFDDGSTRHSMAAARGWRPRDFLVLLIATQRKKLPTEEPAGLDFLLLHTTPYLLLLGSETSYRRQSGSM